ncbi:MAG: hypothetical protein AABX88_01080 [Nanoarchaeota archaeon]
MEKQIHANPASEKFKGKFTYAIVKVPGEEIYVLLEKSNLGGELMEKRIRKGWAEFEQTYQYEPVMIYDGVKQWSDKDDGVCLDGPEKILSLTVGKLNLGRKISESELANLLIEKKKEKRKYNSDDFFVEEEKTEYDLDSFLPR